MDITLDIAAVLGWAVALLTIALSVNTLLKESKRKKAAMKEQGELEQKKEQKQQEILDAIGRLDKNICLLYEVIVPILESEKVNLQGLAGQKLNGNVESAMKKIDAAHSKIMKHMTHNMGRIIE